MQTDEELAIAAADGDDASFRELMRRHAGRAFNLARSYVKTAEDAEDVAQDSFFKAWKHLKRFDGSKRFSPWLLAIVRNTALDFLKKKRGISFSLLDAASGDGDGPAFADTIADEEPLADELFERAEAGARVTEALDILHPDHRMVLLLRYENELSFDEIAEAMRTPMNTVKSWHRRALFKLRDELHRRSRSHRN